MIFAADRLIPFPLETSKGDTAKRIAYQRVNEHFVSLLEVGPLTAPGCCDLMVGPGPDSAACYGLSIDEGRLLSMLTVHQLLRGKAGEDALEIAVILMMYRQNP